ncbi:MAG TPA: uroporphyrinogen-III C-methyltransferase [Gemmataceae bacterium]|jgi:uroporphyrinogen III methyltransferase/synthase|nr:uroporphyrinogen-III C-methyltransferase [Gemmataceae bacterium]
MSDATSVGKVYLVGAGPGDVGLLTLRAIECLQLADFVLYDYLTAPRTLDFARPEAEKFRVTQLPGTHAERWPHITAKIIEQARQGKSVVHLKGGDPLVFGRGAEEADALRAAGIPFEIVPGVSAAFAAAACAEIPLTHRACASAVALVTGHEEPGKAGAMLDWDALAKFPGTLAVYMGVTQLPHIVHELTSRGMSPQTPAAQVYRASTGEQRTVTAPLGQLVDEVRRAGLGRPSLLLVGPAVAMRPQQLWFEARPLFGMRVMVTRPKAQALPFVRKLELLGAIPLLLPTIEVRPAADWAPVDAAIERLAGGGYEWVVFTSANGVTAFFDRLKSLSRDARTFGRAQLAAIGPATATTLAEQQLIADLVPTEQMNSERLAEMLVERCRDQRVLIVQAADGRGLLRQRLQAVAQVDFIAAYEQAAAVDIASPVFERLRRGDVDAITLTSPNIAKALLAACDESIRSLLRTGRVQLVVNSVRLAEMLTGEGLSATVATTPTVDGVTEALIALRQTSKGTAPS